MSGITVPTQTSENNDRGTTLQKAGTIMDHKLGERKERWSDGAFQLSANGIEEEGTRPGLVRDCATIMSAQCCSAIGNGIKGLFSQSSKIW